MQPCVQDCAIFFCGRSLRSTGFFALLCVPQRARILPFGRGSPRWHALTHLLGDDVEEQFRFLERSFFEIPENAYFIRVLSSRHRWFLSPFVDSHVYFCLLTGYFVVDAT